MIRVRHGICMLGTAIYLLAVYPCSVNADDKDIRAEKSFMTMPEGQETEAETLFSEAEMYEDEAAGEFHTQGGGFTGYRFVGSDGLSGNASRYDYLHSGIIGGIDLNGAGNDLQYSLDGHYINDKDYFGDFLYDFQSTYTLHLRTESLFHHSWHEPLSPSFSTATSIYSTFEAEPSARYGQRAEQDLAQFRYKLPNYPLHLNLGYWRLVREGSRQLIYSDQQFGIPAATAASTIYSSGRQVNRETHEGRAGFDTHLGPVDLVYSFLIRDFHDKAGMPRDAFATRIPGQTVSLQHDEMPDSRYTAHTVKIHTSLDGGITGGVSYTLGDRQNRSRLTDFTGADASSATLHNLAGDFTYTPCGRFSLALKYRRQEVENSNPAVILAPSLANQAFSTRPAFSTSRDLVTATMTIRPFRLATLKGEYRADVLHHDFQESLDQRFNWHRMADDSLAHRGTLAILGRPVKSLRLKAQYSYATTDQPEHTNSPQDEHKGEILTTYAASQWGATARYLVKRETTDNPRQVVTIASDPLSYALFSPVSGRTSATNDGTVSLWVTPYESFTITGSYGLIQRETDQGILFTSGSSPVQDLAHYTSRAHFYSINATYRFNEKTNLSAGLQQIRSVAEFSPEPLAVSAGIDTSGIRELSQVRTVESALSSRIDYQFSRTFSSFLDYSYRDYDDKYGTSADGTAQVVMASIQARW